MPVADSFCIANPSSNATDSKRYIIIFLTGNPGLIGYYDTFLTHLYALLEENPGNAKSNDITFEIHGSSLPGFETEDLGDEEKRRRWKGLKLDHDAPFSLEETICAMEQSMFQIIKKSKACNPGDTKVILIGHSLGAFIALEIIERHRKRLEIKQAMEGEPRIVGGIGLFPCVFEMRQSKSGIRLQRLSQVPFFKTGFPHFLYLLICLIPLTIIPSLIRLVTGMPKDAAATTTAFLRSPKGIRSALYLACDEIETITTDKWSDEIWGAAYPSRTGVPRPRLHFFFGEEDHWVSGKARNELILMRGGEEEWRPKMEVDRTGIPHGFCIKHSIPVAVKVADCVRDVVKNE